MNEKYINDTWTDKIIHKWMADLSKLMSARKQKIVQEIEEYMCRNAYVDEQIIHKKISKEIDEKQHMNELEQPIAERMNN